MLLHLSSFSEGPFVPSISRTVLEFLDSRNPICYRPAIQTSQWQASVHFDPEQQPGGEAGHCNPFRACTRVVLLTLQAISTIRVSYTGAESNLPLIAASAALGDEN